MCCRILLSIQQRLLKVDMSWPSCTRMCLCVRAPLVPIIACLIKRIRFWDKYNVDMLGVIHAFAFTRIYWVALCLPNVMYYNKHIWFSLWRHAMMNHVWMWFKQLFGADLFSRHQKISSIMLSMGTIYSNICMSRKNILYDIYIKIWFTCTDAHIYIHEYTHIHTHTHVIVIHVYMQRTNPKAFAYVSLNKWYTGASIGASGTSISPWGHICRGRF